MTAEIRPSVETWDRHWLEVDVEGKKPNFFLISAIEEAMGGSVVDKRILEVGCGASSNAVELARRGANVFVLDFSPYALETTRRFAEESGVSLLSIQADAEYLPVADDSVDVIYSQGLVEHFLPPDQLMKEQVRVVKPGGFVLVDVPQLFSLHTIIKKISMSLNRWPYDWERNYSEEQLRELLERFGLEPVAAYAHGILPPVHFGMNIIKFLRDLGHKMTYRESEVGGEVTLPAGGLKFKFQRSWLARHLLGCIGIVAQKPQAA